MIFTVVNLNFSIGKRTPSGKYCEDIQTDTCMSLQMRKSLQTKVLITNSCACIGSIISSVLLALDYNTRKITKT